MQRKYCLLLIVCLVLVGCPGNERVVGSWVFAFVSFQDGERFVDEGILVFNSDGSLVFSFTDGTIATTKYEFRRGVVYIDDLFILVEDGFSVQVVGELQLNGDELTGSLFFVGPDGTLSVYAEAGRL